MECRSNLPLVPSLSNFGAPYDYLQNFKVFRNLDHPHNENHMWKNVQFNMVEAISVITRRCKYFIAYRNWSAW